ncbi:MAG: lysophospholipase L1-like esterase [Cryomorphaceae bacterium]|jgi:lysophospholipase L1-like esterase
MSSLLSKGAPDVAVIHIGSEDIVSSASAAEPLTNEIIGNIKKVIEALRSKNKNVKIVLAKIIPIRERTDQVQLLNRKISQLTSTLSMPLSPVMVADLASGFKVSENLAGGGILPTPKGAKIMAGVFAGAINDLLSDKEE